MSKLKRNFYFISFLDLVEYPLKEAELLKEIIINYHNIDIEEEIKKMHEIEHQADMVNHEVVLKLTKEFITPIEREDIIAICQSIDNVTDAIEDVLLRFYMYNVKELRDDLLAFINIIIKSCQALDNAFEEFPNFRKSTKLKEYIVQVNYYEEKGDRLYTEAVRRLFAETKDPITLMVWEEIYYRLENCCDACEEVVTAIEGVIMKNI